MMENNADFRQIYDPLRLGVAQISLAFQIEYVNKAYCRMLGYSEEELIGKHLKDITHPAAIEEDLHRQSQLAAGKLDHCRMEKRFIHKTGTTVHGMLDACLVQDSDGNPSHFLYSVVDITDRIQAEKKLRKSEDQFRLLADYTLDWEYWVDLNGQFVYISPSCERITGYSPREILSDPQLVFKMVKPAYAEKVHQHYFEEGSEKASSFSMEFPIVARNGQEVWLEHNCRPIYDDQGRYVGRRGNNRDITDRWQAEDKLKKTEERYRRLIEQSPGISYHFSTASGGLFCSSAVKDILGYSPDELRENPFLWTHSIHPGDMDKVQKAIQKAFLNEKFNLIYRIHDKKGNWHWFHDQAIGITIKNNEIIIEGLAVDITDSKKNQEELIQSEHKFKTLFEFIPQPVSLTELTDGKIKDINKNFCELTGYTKAELIGQTTTETGFYSQNARNQILEKLRASGQILGLEIEFKKKDGSIIQTFLFSRLVEIGQEKLILSIFVDVTEKNRLEAQLQQAQKMESVGRLAGGVAHDYNNALSVIMGYTELAMTDADPQGPLHKDLAEVLKAAERAKNITRQLLAFARKQTIAPEILDLNENIETMLKMLRRLIGEDIDLAWLPGKGLWQVKMDPSQIDQILANLCVNARDAIAGVGKITIETKRKFFDAAYCTDHTGFIPGEFVLMAVSDNGCGMDKKIQDNIFEPFFTTKDVDKGTGLGLSTVYGIVKQNNGFINVYSEPGKGTIIKIYFPRYKGKPVVIQEESTGKIPQGQGETILVVEDDHAILELTQKILGSLGYTILVAGTPKEAVRVAREYTGKIHLLITDVIMPEMNGLELADSLQALYPDLKRMFMSGYTANAIAHHGVLDKGVYFIQKPFSKKELAIIVRKAMDTVCKS